MAAALTDSALTQEGPTIRAATRNEVVSCDDQACEVKDHGMLVTGVQWYERDEEEVLLRLAYRVPTPANRMARMCPKDLVIRLAPEGEIWKPVSVALMSAC